MTPVPAGLVPEMFRGLPFHPLVIHATVVLLPLTALALVLAAFSASVRARLGVVLPLLGVVCVVLVPITTSSGSQYKDTLTSNNLQNPTLERHADLADQVLPWTIGLTVMTIVVYAVLLLGRRVGAPRSVGAATTADRPASSGPALAGRSPLSIAVAVLSVAVAVGLVATVAAVGELGARSVYGGG